MKRWYGGLNLKPPHFTSHPDLYVHHLNPYHKIPIGWVLSSIKSLPYFIQQNGQILG